MATLFDVDEIAVVGGNALLDLANTRSGPPGGAPDSESLHTYDDLLRWDRRIGTLDDAALVRLRAAAARHPRLAAAAFDRARALRDDAYAAFHALATGHAAPPDVVGRLQAAAAEALEHAVLGDAGDGRFAPRWAATDDLDRAWWPVAYAGLELLLRGPLDRVKGCGGCRYLFLDETKNRSRRWCRMDDCGTRAKTRTFVARRAARRAAGAGAVARPDAS
jgi:predicted RNA-binding Zn ribbon-like protein